MCAIFQTWAVVFFVGKTDGFAEASALALLSAPLAFITLPYWAILKLIRKF